MAGLSFAHARYLSPHLAKRTVEVVQEAFPMRFKAFHVLHEPFYMDAILSVLKPFLKDKIRRRIHLHGNDLNSLYKHIPRDCLPAGKLKSQGVGGVEAELGVMVRKFLVGQVGFEYLVPGDLRVPANPN